MRRRALIVLVLAVIAAAFFGTWRVAYRMGEDDGRSKVVAARTAFLARAGGNPQAGVTGGSPVAAGTRGASGSVAAGSGARRTADGTAPGGTTRPSGVVSTLTGHVTKIDGPTVSVQQADNSTVAVTTNSETAIQKSVVSALADLKTGDVITVDGTKTGDTAYSAKTITNLGQRAGGTGGDAGRPPNAAPPGVPGPAVTGRITSMDSGTITVQGFDGATVTVTSSPATVVKTQQPGTLSDIKTGDLIVILGDKTGDTGFLARSIVNQGASTG